MQSIDTVVTAIGLLIPKASGYSDYFRANGMAPLANELLRVYGFCALLFFLSMAAYIGGSIVVKRLRSSTLRQKEPVSQRQRYIAGIAAIAVIFAAYSAFVGFGLMPLSHFGIPDESTSGDYVIGWEIVDFAFLLALSIYLIESKGITK
jgi:hypothetical protein